VGERKAVEIARYAFYVAPVSIRDLRRGQEPHDGIAVAAFGLCTHFAGNILGQGKVYCCRAHCPAPCSRFSWS